MDRMNKQELLELLESFKLDSNLFTMLSSSALVMRGILDTAGDLDIGVTKEGLEELKKNYDLIKKDNGWYIVTDKIECVPDSMESKKELFEGYYIQDINNYLDYLKTSKREKDKLRIPLVEEYIKNR